jgi:hypothetical protein
MCYSAEISLLTFVVGAGFSWLLTRFPDPMTQLLGYFFGFVSLMQGIEFFLWKHQVCDSLHKGLSITGMILNHLQPVVLGVLAAWFLDHNVGMIAILVVAYLIIAIPYSLSYATKQNLHCTVPQCGNPHLIWNWNNMPNANFMYAIFILTMVGIALVGFKDPKHKLLGTIGTVATFGLSRLFYGRASVGALWCFWVMLIPPALYFIPTLR